MGRRTAGLAQREYRGRIRAWSLGDWANSAFATTVLAAVLPAYYAEVAGATLPSPATATAYWAAGLAFSFFLVAVLSPIFGTISDVMRAKKLALALFVSIGVTGTGLLVLVSTGDWLLASLLFIVGQVGFGASNVFYDALLPHVAVERDEDRVSARGYAMGYLGGGLLLAINVVMILLIPDEDNWGVRLAFLSVALWWAAFTLPLLRRVPEPPAATARLRAGASVVGESFRRLRRTFGNVRKFRYLVTFLLAFLVYQNGIATIIGVAVIYGAELGFGNVELVSAVLLVQFASIPFTLMFGRIPDERSRRRPVILAFLALTLAALPVVGAVAARLLDAGTVGRPQGEFATTADALGEGEFPPTDARVTAIGDWTLLTEEELGRGARTDYLTTATAGSRLDIPFTGQRVEITYSEGPAHGTWEALIDGQPAEDVDGDPAVVDGYRARDRFGVPLTVDAGAAGSHVLSIVATPAANPDSEGTVVGVGEIEVLAPVRGSSPLIIFGILAATIAGALALALVWGPVLFRRVAATMDTKKAILLGLAGYTVIAVWGFFLDAIIEFWFLAVMVAVVQGGTQSLSRSLYASMSPASQSGEFFGFFSSVTHFAAIIGPLAIALVAVLTDSTRPAVLVLAAAFVLGALLLTRVDVDEGRRVAREHDAGALRYPRHVEGGLAHYGRPTPDSDPTSRR